DEAVVAGPDDDDVVRGHRSGSSLRPLEQRVQSGRHLHAEDSPGGRGDYDPARHGGSVTAGGSRPAGPSLRAVGRIGTAAIALVGPPLAAFAASPAGSACPTR